jgi:hypothetical protein
MRLGVGIGIGLGLPLVAVAALGAYQDVRRRARTPPPDAAGAELQSCDDGGSKRSESLVTNMVSADVAPDAAATPLVA